MGPGFALLVWLILAGLFAVVWLTAFLLWRLGRRRKWPVLAWPAGLATAALSLLGIFVAGVIAVGLLRSMNPKCVFEDCMNAKTTPGTSDIKSRVFDMGDTGSVYLSFRIPEGELRGIVPDRMQPSSMADWDTAMALNIDDGAPDWWKLDRTPKPHYLAWLRVHDGSTPGGPHGGKGFASETEYLVYDRNTQTAYYRFQGIE